MVMTQSIDSSLSSQQRLQELHLSAGGRTRTDKPTKICENQQNALNLLLDFLWKIMTFEEFSSFFSVLVRLSVFKWTS